MTVTTFWWCLWDELSRNFRSPAVQLSTLVMSSLCVLAVTTGSLDLNARLAEFEPGRVARPVVDPQLRRPPQLGAVVVRGSDPFTPDAWQFTRAGAVSLPIDARRGGDSEVGPPFDVAIVIRWFAGLLALLLGAQVVQEALGAGWFRAWAALPTGGMGVMVARSLGVVLVTLYLLGVLLTVTSVALQFTIRSPDLGLTQAAVWWLLAPSAAYLVFMVGVGMVISAVVQAPLRTAMFSALAWLLLALVGPQAVVSLTRVGHLDVPTVVQAPDRDALAGDAPDDQDPTFPNLFEQVLAIVSPGSLLLDVSADLMGTGPHTREAWQKAVEAQHERWARTGFGPDLPEMSLPRMTLQERWADAARPMVWLSCYGALAWLIALVACARLRGAMPWTDPQSSGSSASSGRSAPRRL